MINSLNTKFQVQALQNQAEKLEKDVEYIRAELHAIAEQFQTILTKLDQYTNVLNSATFSLETISMKQLSIAPQLVSLRTNIEKGLDVERKRIDSIEKILTSKLQLPQQFHSVEIENK